MVGGAAGGPPGQAKVLATATAREAAPSDRMRRIGSLLGAAGNLMVDAPWTGNPQGRRDGVAVRDKVYCVLRTPATVTLSYLDVVPSLIEAGSVFDEDLRRLVEQTRAITVTSPSARAGRYDDLAVNVPAVPGEATGRGAVFDGWQHAATAALGTRFATSNDLSVACDDLSLVAQVAALTLRTGGSVGLIDPVTALRAATSRTGCG